MLTSVQTMFGGALLALAGCTPRATLPRPEHAFSASIRTLEGQPVYRGDLDLVLQRVDRADLRVRVVPAELLPRATHLWRTTGVSALPVVLSFEVNSTQCEARAESSCTHADLSARRDDGRHAEEFHLEPPRGETDPTRVLLWALGMTTLVLPAGALLVGDPTVMAPPGETPAPAERLAAYERLDRELQASGLYVARTYGTRGSYGRVFRPAGDSPLADLVVELYLDFGHVGDEQRRCYLELVVPEGRLRGAAEVELDRRDVCSASCSGPIHGGVWRPERGGRCR